MPDPGGLAARTFRSTGPGGAPRPPSGPPVLLVHGFASDGDGDWIATGLAAALADTGRTVVVPDLPGHGRSPDPATPEDAAAPAQAAALLASLDAAGDGGSDGGFDVVGYSLGARLAWEIAVAAPARVRRAVLGGLSPGEPFAAVDVAALRAAVRDGSEPADPLTAAIAGMAKARGERAGALAACVEGLRATPFEPGDWPGEEPPVFVLGEDDGMARGVTGLAERVGGARLVVVPGAHHEVLAGPGFRGTVLNALAR